MLSALPLDLVSADAKYVLAWRAAPLSMRMGNVWEPLLVSTATGEAVSFGVFGGFPQVFWEGPRHVLLSMMTSSRDRSGADPNTRSWLLRLGTDGALERVAGPTRERIVLPTRGQQER